MALAHTLSHANTHTHTTQANVRSTSVMQPTAVPPSERSVAQLGSEAFAALAEAQVQPVSVESGAVFGCCVHARGWRASQAHSNSTLLFMCANGDDDEEVCLAPGAC